MSANMWIAAAAVIIIIYLFYFRVTKRMSTSNNTFYDSMRDRTADYFYDNKGMTLIDYSLEQKALGGFI